MGMDEAELATLKAKIDQLQTAYFVLFAGSLVVLAFQWFIYRTGATQLVWVLCLGGAVAVRVYRTSLVNKYNAHITGTLQ